MIITKEGFAILENDTHMGKWVESAGRLDFDFNALNTYKDYFREGDVLLNIGANIGCYAYPFIEKAEHVICFEPHPEAYKCLEYNVGKFFNTTLYNLPVSSEVQDCFLQRDENNVGASWISFDKENDNRQFTCYIDQFNFKQINFVVMDCEGFEYNVLEGAEKTIDKFRPIIVMEVNEHALKRQGRSPTSLITWMYKKSYEVRNIYVGQAMSGPQYDVICFPNEL